MFNNILASELKNLENINLIDIRNEESFFKGHISGAVNIPLDKLLIYMNKYLDREKEYYIYCQKGIQSKKTCQLLSNSGYNVINVLGGYESWIDIA